MKSVAGSSFATSATPSGSWWSAYGSDGEVATVHVDVRPDPAREGEAFAWLDREERSVWRKYLPGPRRRFSLCRAALRAMLCNRLDCRNEQLSFALSEYEKPFALLEGAKAPVSFNVSHSGNHGLIALAAEGRLGIDVEEPVDKRNLDGLIEMVMGPDERAQLDSLRGIDRLRLFYRIWTCKEALIKALGTGFSTDISKFQMPPAVREGNEAVVFRLPELPSVAWSLSCIGNEQFEAALAYELAPCSAPIGGPEPDHPEGGA